MSRPLSEHAPSVLVAGLSSAFGVTLLEITTVLSQMVSHDSSTAGVASVTAILQVLAMVFIVIATYVGAIVTANTFATIIAGRTRTIALLRLIGSSAAAQRRSVAREGLLVGVVGSILGASIGTIITGVTVWVSMANGLIRQGDYELVQPVVALPVLVVILTTWLASWIGSRRVLDVSPVEATGGAVERSQEELGSGTSRRVFAIVLFVIGVGLLVLGMLVGLVSPLGVLVGVLGGLLSFTGVVLGAQVVMPATLRLFGRMFGSSATARLAAENAVRYPERSARATIGLVIGVTLVTMFAVAVQSFQNVIQAAERAQPGAYEGTDDVLNGVVIVFSTLIEFSALIAAVGMVNTLSLSVLQRTRELGLLRALGFTARQVRLMILAESAQLTIASVALGLVLGTFYGWAGAQSLLGSILGSPGIVLPGIPFPLLLAVVGASLVLIVVASVAPARRATRITPVAALAVG